MRRRRRGRKSKFVTKRGLPFQMMKYQETKFKDKVVIGQILTTLPALPNQLAHLTDISAGDEQDARDGNMIQLTGIYVRIIHEANLTSAGQFIRVCLSSNRNATDFSTPILDATTPPDPDNFKVWYDKTFFTTFLPGGGKGVIEIRKKFKPYMKVIWDSGVSFARSS